MALKESLAIKGLAKTMGWKACAESKLGLYREPADHKPGAPESTVEDPVWGRKE